MASVNQPPARTYGGMTGDERTAERRAALVDAAFALVAEHGWRALRIDALCREAGLNKRYFYESFDGLDAVVAAVTQQVAGDAIAVTLAAVDEGPSDGEATRRGIRAFVGHLTDDPRRARVLFGAVPAGEAADVHRTEALRQLIATAAATGRSLHDLADDAFTDLVAAMLVGGTSQAVLDWLDGRIASSQDELVDHLATLWQLIGDGVAAYVRGGGRG